MSTNYKMPVGIMQAPITPFHEDYEVDYGTLEKVVDFHTRTPRNTGVLALYNKAEPHALTIEERKKIAEVTIDTVAGRLPVIIHVGHPSTDVAVELAEHAQEAGAFGIVCITPYYWSLDQKEVKAHYDRLFEAVDIGVMVYNNPRRIEAGELSTELLLELIDTYPNFMGMKDASHEMDWFTEYCRTLQTAKPGFSVMTGIEYLAGSVPVGGTGSFSACGAVAPTLTYDLWDAVTAGDWDLAYDLQHKASWIHQQFKDQYPSSLKIGMELMGRPVGPCRPPLPTGDDATRARVRRILESCNVLETESMAGEAARAVVPSVRDSAALVAATGINNGLVHQPVTPFKASREIDFDLYGKVLDFHAAQRPGAVALPLDVGERFSLRDEERKELVKFAVDRIGKTTPVIVDVTHVGTGICVSFAAHAQKVGAKGVLLTTPYFQRPPKDMMLEHFRQIAAATDLAVLLYSSPRTHKGEVRIGQEMVAKLMDSSPNIVGYIDGEMYWQDFTWLRRYTLERDPHFLMFPDAEYLTTSMPIGANGSLTTLTAIAPKMIGELYRACRQKEYHQARELQQRVGQLALLMRKGASVPAKMKAAMALMGRPVGDPRQPNLPLDKAAVDQLRADLKSLNVIGTEPEGWNLSA